MLRRGGILYCWLLILLLTSAAAAAPRVAVVDCAPAAEWLSSAGVECLSLTREALETAPVPNVQLLILPLDRVRSATALRSVTAFAARGGKVIAVYWGTLARPEQQADYPVYGAAASLGFRVLGWTSVGPAIVQLSGARQEGIGRQGAPTAAVAVGRGVGNRLPEFSVDRLMMVQVAPDPLAQVLAWIVPQQPFGATSSGQGPAVLALRHGNFYYVAANLFHSGGVSSGVRGEGSGVRGQSPARAPARARARARMEEPNEHEHEQEHEGPLTSEAERRLFFWIVDEAVPGIAAAQARERAGAAMAAVIRAQERLSSSSPSAARRLLEEAREAAMKAKTLAASDQYVESAAAAQRAQDLAQEAVGMLGDGR